MIKRKKNNVRDYRFEFRRKCIKYARNNCYSEYFGQYTQFCGIPNYRSIIVPIGIDGFAQIVTKFILL